MAEFDSVLEAIVPEADQIAKGPGLLVWTSQSQPPLKRPLALPILKLIAELSGTCPGNVCGGGCHNLRRPGNASGGEACSEDARRRLPAVLKLDLSSQKVL